MTSLRHGFAALPVLWGIACTQPATADLPPTDATERAVTDDTAPSGDAGSGLPDVPSARPCALTSPPVSSGHLTASGTTLRDTLGRQVFLRGVNFGGRSKLPPFFPFEFGSDAEFDTTLAALLDELQSWGVSVLRLPFNWEAVEPARGAWDEVFLARYGRVLDAAWARGIRVVVDFHQDVYARVYCGDGFPVWTLGTLPHGAPHADCPAWFDQYFAPDSGPSQAFDRLWTNADGVTDDLEHLWRELATRYGNHPAVAGFELLNEPGTGSQDPTLFEQMILPALVRRLGAAIRESAPEVLVFEGAPPASGVNGDAHTTDPGLNGYVYAPHFYDPFVLLGGRYLSPRMSRLNLDTILALGPATQRPVFLGEFGASYESVDAGRFLRDVFDLLDARLAHGTVWEFSLGSTLWNNEKLSLLTPEGNERSYVSEVVRAFPRAVDGEVRSLHWDATAHTLALTVAGSASGITEVFLPTRHVGTAPRLQLSSGCVDWNASAQRLLVRADTPDWTLTVLP